MRLKFSLLLSFYLVLWSASAVFGGQLLFTPRISTGGEYYHREYKVGAEPREHDYITTVSPGFSVEYLEKRYGATLSYDPTLAFYNEESENDTTRHSGNLHAWAEITKNTSLSFTDSLFKSEDPKAIRDLERDLTDDHFDELDGITRRGRSTYLRNTATLNLDHRFGKGSSIGFGYLYSFLENDDPTKDDNTRHEPSMNLTYRLSSWWSIEASTSLTKGEFDDADDQKNWDSSIRLVRTFSRHFDGYLQYRHTVMDYDGETEDYRVYNPTAGIQYRFDKDTSMRLGMGYYIKDNDITSDDGEISFDGDISRIWKIGRGSISLIGSAGYENASFGSENLGFNVFYQMGLTGSYPFTRDLSGTASTTYRYDTYKDADDRNDQSIQAGVGMNYRIGKRLSAALNVFYKIQNSSEEADDVDDRDDQFIQADVGLKYQFRRWLSAGLNGSYEIQDSSEKVNEFDESRITFNITMVPPGPIRMGD